MHKLFTTLQANANAQNNNNPGGGCARLKVG